MTEDTHKATPAGAVHLSEFGLGRLNSSRSLFPSAEPFYIVPPSFVGVVDLEVLLEFLPLKLDDRIVARARF